MIKPKLYSTFLSPFGRKVMATAALKKIAYELEPVSPFAPPQDWLSISPLGKIPAWRDDRLTLADSSVICEYLDEIVPEPCLYLNHPVLRAQCRWFEEYADTAMVEAMVFAVFAQRVVKPLFQKIPGDEALVDKACKELIPPVLDYLEQELGNNEFLVDNRFSMADLAVVSPLINLVMAAPEFALGKWTGVYRLYQSVIIMDELAEIIAKEERILQKNRS